MEWLQNTDAGDWIDEATREEPFGVISRLIPNGYAAYCRILHPVYEEPDVENHALTWDQTDGHRVWESHPREAEIAAEVLREFGGTSQLITAAPREAPAGASRVSWAALAERYSYKLTVETCFSDIMGTAGFESWPRYLLGPHEGDLGPEFATRLSLILSSTQAAEDVWLTWFPTLAPDLNISGARGGISDLPLVWADPRVRASAWRWWPDSRSWCIVTDVDCTFTIVGGPAGLIDAVMSEPELESQVLTPDTAFKTS